MREAGEGPSRSRLGVAVVGPGRAGRARVRALDEHPDAALIAVVRREPGANEPTLEQVLRDPEIEAVIVCTPHLLHAPMARAALEAGKHVLVEFPLAARSAEGRALFALARDRGRVLHVEHIELLSPGQRAQRERARRLGRPVGGELRFSGSNQGWIGDAGHAGSPALRALPRLHRLMDLYGEAEATRAELVSTQRGGYRLDVDLRFRRSGELRLVEERGPALARALRWRIRAERGTLDDPPAHPAAGFFREDLDWFLSRVREGGASYVADERVLAGLELVEQIEAHLG